MLTIIIVLIGIFPIAVRADITGYCSEDGDVRLVGGFGEYEGNVQLCLQYQWRYVCDYGWGTSDAKVVCGQLGYTTYQGVFSKSASYYGFGVNITSSVSVLPISYNCQGYESMLNYCANVTVSSSLYCTNGNIAGAFCSFGDYCLYGDIRLLTYGLGRSEGKLQVCLNGEWGTVCSNLWEADDATVACKQFGFQGYFDSYKRYYFGSYGSIWVDDLQCSASTHSRLLSCPYSTVTWDCTHDNDVGIRCYTRDLSPCVDGDIKLWSAFNSTPENEGIVLVCRSSTWYPVTYYYNDCHFRRIACRRLGYNEVAHVRSNAGYFYGYYDTLHYSYTCASSQQSVSQCTVIYRGSTFTASLGIKCGGTYTADCEEGSVRLMNGHHSNEGRVEYCYNGAWSAMCSLSAYTGRLICRHLGYSDWSLLINDEQFGRLQFDSEFSYISCDSLDTDLNECTAHANCNPTVCSTQYGLRCFNDISDECTDGDIRLVDGDIEQEGRPEVCVNGIWGSICSVSFYTNDAHTACLTLGYNGGKEAPKTYISTATGPIVWSSVNCVDRWITNVYDCNKVVYPHFSCNANQAIGIICTEDCLDGDIRLAGGHTSNEGTVEVCFNSRWGQISDSGWSDGDARFVCNKLGHKGGISRAVLNSHYGKSKKIIHLANVACMGHEKEFTDCSHTRLSLVNGKKVLPGTKVAGVDCIDDGPAPPPSCVTIHAPTSSVDSCSSKGDIRLVNNNIAASATTSPDEGRVEYCNGEYWTPLCSMDNRAAAVACRQLGYTQYEWGSVIVDESFKSSLNFSLVENITCSTGFEDSLAECILYKPVDDKCFPWCPNKNIGLKCFAPSTGLCKEGAIRLVDGVIEREGRVEVCVDGVWGSICNEGWDSIDGYIACQQLGYPKQEPIVFNGSFFGNGQYPVVYSNMKCSGWEESLTECQKDTYYDIQCKTRSTVSLLCGDDCKDGEIRLSGGSYANEGTVEVCFGSVWGTVSETGWTKADADVVCRSIGSSDSEETLAQVGSYYGKSNRTVVHLSDVQCEGSEENILECTYTKYSLEKAKEKLLTVEVAGVKCYPPVALPPSSSPVASTVSSDRRAVIILGVFFSLMILVSVALTVALLLTCYFKTKSPKSEPESNTPNNQAAVQLNSSNITKNEEYHRYIVGSDMGQQTGSKANRAGRRRKLQAHSGAGGDIHSEYEDMTVT